MTYCENCDERENCEDKDEIAFCDGCVNEDDCELTCGFMGYCNAGHPIQCNNGYECESLWEDKDEEE